MSAELGDPWQARRGELVDVLEGDGLAAWDGAGIAGIVTWVLAGDEAEIRALAVAPRARRRGIGRQLLIAAAQALRASGVSTAWLVTTNDNAPAIALYEELGYRLRDVRRGAVDELRRTLKPGIPRLGHGGTPMTDELEYAIDLG